MKRVGLLVLALLCGGLLGVDRPEGLGDVADVRHWSYSVWWQRWQLSDPSSSPVGSIKR